MDRVALLGLRASGRHGWEPHERERPQPFLVDLELEIDLRAAERSDDLADTVDYAALHHRVIELVERASFALLERLGGAILELAFEDRRVCGGRVTIRKPQALAEACAAVTLERRNPAGGTR